MLGIAAYLIVFGLILAAVTVADSAWYQSSPPTDAYWHPRPTPALASLRAVTMEAPFALRALAASLQGIRGVTMPAHREGPVGLWLRLVEAERLANRWNRRRLAEHFAALAAELHMSLTH